MLEQETNLESAVGQPAVLPDAGLAISNIDTCDSSRPPRKNWFFRMSRRGKLVVTFALFILILVIVVAVVAIPPIVRNIGQCRSVVDSFMTAMQKGEVEQAYEFFSAEAQEYLSFEELESWLVADSANFFERYNSLSIRSFNYSSGPVSDQSVELSGLTHHGDGSNGYLYAQFRKVSGEWKLYYIELGK